MEQNTAIPTEEKPQKRNTGLIIAIVVVVVICCCLIGACAAVYFGYDYLDDPLGIYGLMPVLSM